MPRAWFIQGYFLIALVVTFTIVALATNLWPFSALGVWLTTDIVHTLRTEGWFK
jgi:hypothetical protein